MTNKNRGKSLTSAGRGLAAIVDQLPRTLPFGRDPFMDSSRDVGKAATTSKAEQGPSKGFQELMAETLKAVEQQPGLKEKIAAGARIIDPDDQTAREGLQSMARALPQALAEMGHEPENSETWHMVQWPAFGLAVAVYGDPSNGKDWANALTVGYFTAYSLTVWPTPLWRRGDTNE